MFKCSQVALEVQAGAAQMCSMPYRAPELFEPTTGGVISSKTDVWSLGCVLYAMAFGYSPFECSFRGGEAFVSDCSYLKVITPVAFPTPCRSSSRFCSLVRWLLQHDPDLRPAVPELVVFLEGWGDGRHPGSVLRTEL